MFGVDKGAGAALLLHLGNDLQRQRGLARGFGTVDFDHATTGQTTHAQSDVQTQRAGGDDLNVFDGFTFAELHDGALAELLFDLGQGCSQGFGFFAVGVVGLGDGVHIRLRSR
ncbi:hypothetical protein SDC9_148096 [bioreactor metagenome]|uniref:Uncharacterized protein n=1 Tax=bioreactor metagenome TaxID=1076179 RepID=A0A645EFX6_9ZZZZ